MTIAVLTALTVTTAACASQPAATRTMPVAHRSLPPGATGAALAGDQTSIPPVIPDSATPIEFAPTSASARDGSQTGAQRATQTTTAFADAVNSAIAGLDTGVFVSASIGPSPDGARSGPWFYATVGCDDADGGCLPDEWEADLAQGAAAEHLDSGQDNLGNVIVGSTIECLLPDGRTLDAGGGASDIVANQAFTGDVETDAEIVSDTQAIIRSDGLVPTTVRVLHPLGPAISVVATVPDLNHVRVTNGELSAQINGPAGGYKYEGIYVELDKADGTVINRTAGAYRSGAGRVWSNPDIDMPTGVGH